MFITEVCQKRNIQSNIRSMICNKTFELFETATSLLVDRLRKNILPDFCKFLQKYELNNLWELSAQESYKDYNREIFCQNPARETSRKISCKPHESCKILQNRHFAKQWRKLYCLQGLWKINNTLPVAISFIHSQSNHSKFCWARVLLISTKRTRKNKSAGQIYRQRSFSNFPADIRTLSRQTVLNVTNFDITISSGFISLKSQFYQISLVFSSGLRVSQFLVVSSRKNQFCDGMCFFWNGNDIL